MLWPQLGKFNRHPIFQPKRRKNFKLTRRNRKHSQTHTHHYALQENRENTKKMPRRSSRRPTLKEAKKQPKAENANKETLGAGENVFAFLAFPTKEITKTKRPNYAICGKAGLQHEQENVGAGSWKTKKPKLLCTTTPCAI